MTTASHTARYTKERPYLESALEDWCEDLSALAADVDKGAFVDGRVKSFRSVIGKLRRDPATPRSWDSLGDLVGLKAVFPTTQGVDDFSQLLLTRVEWHPRLDDRKAGPDKLEYAAKQFDLWRDDLVDSMGNPVKIEVQVRTAAADAWYVVDHRLNYKGLVPLPNDLKRKVLRLTVLAELFDEEVRAIFDAQASLEEYGVARAYDFLTRKIDEMTNGLATASRPEALVETLLGAYSEDELPAVEELLVNFLDGHGEAVAATVRGHQHNSTTFVEDRDWLYSEPEALIIAERSYARPALLRNALAGSDYERTVSPMINAFQLAIGHK